MRLILVHFPLFYALKTHFFLRCRGQNTCFIAHVFVGKAQLAERASHRSIITNERFTNGCTVFWRGGATKHTLFRVTIRYNAALIITKRGIGIPIAIPPLCNDTTIQSGVIRVVDNYCAPPPCFSDRNNRGGTIIKIPKIPQIFRPCGARSK